MGVKTNISLKEVNLLFPSYDFTDLTATKSGIIDTTYIIRTKKKEYILKKYEREIDAKIKEDIEILKSLKSVSLNVPLCLDAKAGWYLYEKLKGIDKKVRETYHIQELARFLASLHTLKLKTKSTFIENYPLDEMLNYTKQNFFYYYKKLELLKNYKPKSDGFIHGDIFIDNTLFHKQKIGVFDFIDGGMGSFSFDCGVALVGFRATNNYFVTLFLKTYNQKRRKKLTRDELIKAIEIASHFYALNRIYKYKHILKVKELLCS